METITHTGTCYIDCVALLLLLVRPSVVCICFMYFTGVKHAALSTYVLCNSARTQFYMYVCVFRSVYERTSVRLLCFVIKTLFLLLYSGVSSVS